MLRSNNATFWTFGTAVFLKSKLSSYMIECVPLSANLLISRPSSNPSSRTWRVQPAFIPIPRPPRPPKAASNSRPRSRYSSAYPSRSRAAWSRYPTFPIYRWDCPERHLGETKTRVISSALKLPHNTVHSQCHTYFVTIVWKKSYRTVHCMYCVMFDSLHFVFIWWLFNKKNLWRICYRDFLLLGYMPTY